MKMGSLLQLAACLFLFCAACSAHHGRQLYRQTAPTADSGPLLFIFGASLFDAGQNSAAMPRRSRSDFQPYGSDYFGTPSGRWSNGRTLMDFIIVNPAADGVGYGLLPPYLKSRGADFRHGANFASSGSTAVNSSSEGDGSGGLFCLLVQVEQFQDFRDSVTSGGELNYMGWSLTVQQFSDAIYLFETGPNDYYKTGMGTSSDEPINVTVSKTIAAMEKAFLALHRLGARTFVVMNIPPLGCYPSGLNHIEDGDELDEYNCNARWNEVVQVHNTHLDELLARLQEFHSTAEWVLFDAYSLYLDAYISPSKYGVKYPSQACCGAGGTYNLNLNVKCGEPSQYIDGELVQWTKCEDPSLYLNWDGRHPVESFAYYLAQGLLNATHVVPPSFNIMNRIRASKGLNSQAHTV